MTYFRTAESVSPKHPDKLCDQISDAVLDRYLTDNPDARCAVEAVGSHGRVFITGEVSSSHHPDIEPTVRQLVGDDVELEVHIVRQSDEIARGVDGGGAGDQGIMVGYACSETPEFLPLEVVLARRLNQHLYDIWPYDGKTQITLAADGRTALVASFQNSPKLDLEAAVRDWIGQLPAEWGKRLRQLDLHVNPAGDWSIGGFDADVGLTGRKLVVDNYGPRIPIGGGCFSGKDATKVDRSAAYMARKIALDYLRDRQAAEVYCRLAYAIGYSQPLESIVVVDGAVEPVVGYDLSPAGIIRYLDLKQPLYLPTAGYGHFGHAEFAWER